jgi:3-methyladenine DNA glycosylase AlkC
MPEQLKNIFFQKKFIIELGNRIREVYPEFNISEFEKNVYTPDFQDLALKAKMRHITESLGKTLPANYPEAVGILMKVEKYFNGFDHLVFADFVERFGLDYFETSIVAFEPFTRISAEFAVRPFILKYQKRMMEQMLKWSKSENAGLRRLSSEGCRPRLPWGIRLTNLVKDPSPILPILENLKNDPSETVRRSVSNNLNDISKDNPKVALDIAEKWYGENKEVDKLIKHALRGLMKKGNPRALALFGHGEKVKLDVKNLKVEPTAIRIGDSGKFSFDLNLLEKETKDLRLEYYIDYVKANGKTSRKIFQLSKGQINPGIKNISRKLDFQDRTTRKHYVGTHKLGIIINGREIISVSFEIVK